MKRTFDLAVSVGALIVLSPLMFMVAVLIRIKLGSPVLFVQLRPGLRGKPFTIYKFRTMAELYDADGRLLSDEQRLTLFGKWMRRYSLDELPQLLNVIKGDLSLVGPRPLLMEYLDRYTPEQARRHEVKPGITGWAQVNGRNELSWEQKFALDVWYVDHRSFGLDLLILWKTMLKVLRSEGISQAGHATMPTYMGSSQEHSSQR
ncbi:MAG: sugar transferase [Paenibacillus sp.]|jgi:sugar transferase EpsL|nr:sugar transferase [Paenibacillus sp.]